MIARFKGWFARFRPPCPKRENIPIGHETRRLLDSGERRLARARQCSRRGEPGDADLHGAEERFGAALRRHPRLIEALEGRAASLCDLALSRMSAGEEAPSEWTLAVVTLGQLLARDNRCAAAHRARAALFLAVAARLRARGAPARASLEQAESDVVRGLELAPGDAGTRGLKEVLDRLQDPATGVQSPLPEIARIRDLAAGHARQPAF